MKATIQITLSLALIMMFALSSCQKEKTIEDDTSASEDLALVEQHFNDVGNISDDAFFGSLNFRGGNQYLIPGPCATITLDTTTVPHLLTIDFGPTNCLCNDGRYRRGIIQVSFTGHYRDSGTVITQTTQNYFVNDNEVNLARTVTNMGHNANGKFWFAVLANGMVVKALNGDTVTHSANHHRIWVLGANTPPRMDDVYLITGTSMSTRPQGTVTSVITAPLRREMNCKWFVSGTININPSNHPLRILDFGNGNCDHFATVTVNGNTHTIILH